MTDTKDRIQELEAEGFRLLEFSERAKLRLKQIAEELQNLRAEQQLAARNGALKPEEATA